VVSLSPLILSAATASAQGDYVAEAVRHRLFLTSKADSAGRLAPTTASEYP